MNYIKYNDKDFAAIGTLKELIDYSALKYDALPLIKIKSGQDVQEISFKQFRSDMNAISELVCELSLKNKNIALLGTLTYEWLAAYFGITCAGAVVVPIDKDLNTADIKALLTKTDITDIFFDASLTNVVEKIKEDMPEIKNMVSLQQNSSYPSVYSRLGGNCAEFNSTVTEDMAATIVFTSGTTGYNKGVVLSHKNLCHDIQYASYLFRNDMKTGYNIIPVLPTHHMFLITAGILSAFWFGMCICIGEGLKYINRTIQFFKPQAIFTVPMVVENLYNRIMIEAQNKNVGTQLKKAIEYSKSLDESAIDIRRNMFKETLGALGGEIKMIICGGARLRTELVEDFNAMGIFLLNGYGITECSPIVTCSVPAFNKPGSVGHIEETCYCKVKIEDEEVLVSGNIVMGGYYKDAAATAQAFSEEWFKTGDIGKIDEDGFLFITGRKKDIIILNDGNNISPDELEEQLKKIPLIKDVVVYAKELERTSVLAASVYPDFENAKQLNSTDLKQKIETAVYEVSSKWPRHKQIQIVEFTNEEFDKTALGKIKRYKVIK